MSTAGPLAGVTYAYAAARNGFDFTVNAETGVRAINDAAQVPERATWPMSGAGAGLLAFVKHWCRLAANG